jgi:hypothetical protein
MVPDFNAISNNGSFAFLSGQPRFGRHPTYAGTEMSMRAFGES